MQRVGKVLTFIYNHRREIGTVSGLILIAVGYGKEGAALVAVSA